MKKIFSTILILTCCSTTFGQNLMDVDTIIMHKSENIIVKSSSNSRSTQDCEVSFENSALNYIKVDCELVLNDSYDGLRPSEEIKLIQNQLLNSGYKIDVSGVLDIETVEAYSDYKRSRRKRRVRTAENVHFSKKLPYVVYEEASSYVRYSLYSWQDIKKYRGKCSAVNIDGKKNKTYKIPCTILDDRQFSFFVKEKIKGLQYQLSNLGYDVDITGHPDIKTFEAYAEKEENKKRALKEEKRQNKKNKK